MHGADGEVVSYQIRPHQPRKDKKSGKIHKYENRHRDRGAWHCNPKARHQLDDPHATLYVTEGVKKADKLAERGLCAVALTGVWNWRGTNEKGGSVALASFNDIAWKGKDKDGNPIQRRVVLVFDSDAFDKPNVNRALKSAGAYFAHRGARISCARLPSGPNDEKTGADDFFVRGGTVELLHLHVTDDPPGIKTNPEPEPSPQLTPEEIRCAFKSGAREYSEPLALADVIAHFRKWLYLEDEGLLEVYLGTIAANLMDGYPVWLMIVGASGGGKTEPLNAAIRLPFVHLAATVTESSLLSGTPKKDTAKDAKGGLLRDVGAFGFLLLKDFTSMLAQRRDASAAVLSAFREIYDGSWTRHVGSDGGTVLHWSGKLAVVAGCTDTIDSHTAVIGTMGERFAFYRLPELKDARKLSRHALNMAGKEAAMRDELSRAVCGLFAGLTLPNAPPEISEAELERLIDLASLAARCRSAVERDNHTRDITLTLSPEAPTRIAKILRQLMHGMDAIGVPRERIWTALEKIAFDSMHKVRRVVIETLLDGQWQATGNIAKAIQYPTGTARRALEELHAHGVVNCEKGGAGKSDSWQLSEWTANTLAAVKSPPAAEKETFPVFPTDDISFSSIEENEDIKRNSNPLAIYPHTEKRERSAIKRKRVTL